MNKVIYSLLQLAELMTYSVKARLHGSNDLSCSTRVKKASKVKTFTRLILVEGKTQCVHIILENSLIFTKTA